MSISVSLSLFTDSLVCSQSGWFDHNVNKCVGKKWNNAFLPTFCAATNNLASFLGKLPRLTTFWCCAINTNLGSSLSPATPPPLAPATPPSLAPATPPPSSWCLSKVFSTTFYVGACRCTGGICPCTGAIIVRSTVTVNCCRCRFNCWLEEMM